MSDENKPRTAEEIIEACKHFDWLQPVLTGSPPCCHIESNGSFCGRAVRWDGHDKKYKSIGCDVDHDFLPFEKFIEQLITTARNEGRVEGMRDATAECMYQHYEPGNISQSRPRTPLEIKDAILTAAQQIKDKQ